MSPPTKLKKPVSLGEMVEPRENVTVLLVDQAVHQTAFFVRIPIIFVLLLAVPARRNHALGAATMNSLAKFVRMLRPITDGVLTLQASNQVFDFDDVMPLTSSRSKGQTVARRIDVDTSLGSAPALAMTKCLGFLSTARALLRRRGGRKCSDFVLQLLTQGKYTPNVNTR